MSIAKSAAKGISWVAFSTLFKGVIQLIQLMILARVLTPIELGLLAIINIVVGFAQIFGDAGISNATIYFKDLTKYQLKQLFAVNIALGTAISGIVLLCAKGIENFYDMSGLATLLMLLAPVFVIKSFGQQQMALLQQQMKFNQLAKWEVLSSLVGFVALMVFLLFGMELEAVIYSQLIAAILLTTLLLLACDVKASAPSLPKIKDIIKPVKYGLYQTGEAFVNYLSAQFDQLLIGKLLGAETLGIYSYIKALVFRPALQLINPVVNRVTFPLMVNYQSKHSLASIYANVLRCLSFINIPLYGGIAVFPELILTLAFGSEWAIHAELLKWLALYMLVISMMNPVGSLLRASGQVKRGFYWNIIVTVIRTFIIFISVEYGLIFLVKALTGLQCAFFVLHWVFLLRPVAKLSMHQFTSAMAYSGSVFCVVAIGVFTVSQSKWLQSMMLQVDAILLESFQLALTAIIYLLATMPQLIKLYRQIKG